jgi:hypothetical protein
MLIDTCTVDPLVMKKLADDLPVVLRIEETCSKSNVTSGKPDR